MKRKLLLIFIIIPLFCFLLLWLFKKPTNQRNWSLDQTVLSQSFIKDDLINIKNIRNASYVSASNYDLKYYDKSFNLSKLKRVWYMVELFSDWRGPAHTLLSFEFENDQFLSISVEVRREKGEEFSILKALVREYELMYVIADEQDVIKLRTNHRKNPVYLFPIKADKATMRSLLKDMLARAEKLRSTPEFYNVLINTCTTNILRHLNRAWGKSIPIDVRVLLPGYFDSLAYKLGIIDTELSLVEAREKFRIDIKAQNLKLDEDFSLGIRR